MRVSRRRKWKLSAFLCFDLKFSEHDFCSILLIKAITVPTHTQEEGGCLNGEVGTCIQGVTDWWWPSLETSAPQSECSCMLL